MILHHSADTLVLIWQLIAFGMLILVHAGSVVSMPLSNKKLIISTSDHINPPRWEENQTWASSSSLQLSPGPGGAPVSSYSMNHMRRSGVNSKSFLPGCGVPTSVQQHMVSANLNKMPYGKEDPLVSRTMFRTSQAKEDYLHGPPHRPPPEGRLLTQTPT